MVRLSFLVSFMFNSKTFLSGMKKRKKETAIQLKLERGRHIILTLRSMRSFVLLIT